MSGRYTITLSKLKRGNYNMATQAYGFSFGDFIVDVERIPATTRKEALRFARRRLNELGAKRGERLISFSPFEAWMDEQD